MTKSNIVLIGMSGCGKSTIGVLLSKALKISFIDTDLLIQTKTGKFLWQILDAEGTDGFKALESETLCSLNCAYTCIATGGSAVYSHKSMEHLKESSVIVYINTPYDLIEKRISNIKSRGVVIEPGKTLRILYDERKPLYEKYADITVDGNLPVEEVVTLIMSHL